METNLSNAVTIAIVGFSAVMIILSIYALIIAGVNKLNIILENKKHQKESFSVTTSTAKIDNNQITDETIAIIMAAVSASMGEKVRVGKIAFLGQHNINSDTAWASMSKSSKFQAHNIIQKRRIQYENK